MKSRFPINRGWPILLQDLGIDLVELTRLAGLPPDFIGRERMLLNTEEYFRLWRSLDSMCQDRCLALDIIRGLSVEAFDPPIFAALCSPNFRVALGRIKTYKQLVLPMDIVLSERPGATQMTLRWTESPHSSPPAVLATTKLLFFVNLVRLATRHQVIPLEVGSSEMGRYRPQYEQFFGTQVTLGKEPTLVFSEEDMNRPFLTSDASMWNAFEPELRRRKDQLDADASTSKRTESVLLELLPSGRSGMDDVSQALGMSKRTLQRKLKSEGRSFQSVLDQTRERLARYYLKSTRLASAEIAYLLGYDSPSSFGRAFKSWTGQTPENLRAGEQLRHQKVTD